MVHDVINNRWPILLLLLIHVGQEIIPIKIRFRPVFIEFAVVLLLDGAGSEEAAT